MNYTKHVEFRSKNKFDKLVYLVGFIILVKIYHFARSPERQTCHDTSYYETQELKFFNFILFLHI